MELIALKGLGNKSLKLLNRLNIYTAEDLINYFPFRYEILKRTDLSNINDGDKIIIDGVVENIPFVLRLKNKLDKMTFRIRLEDRISNVVIFNRGFLKLKIKPNTFLTIIGKYDLKHNTIIASDIKFGKIESFSPYSPIYHTVSGITSKQIQNLVEQVITGYNINNVLPEEIINKYKFISRYDSILNVHFPKDERVLKKSVNHLKYEELFLFMLKMNHLKLNKNITLGLKRNIDYNLIEKFINKLPFELTEDQLKTVNNIYEDLISEKRMNRLIQGDVGSGKTIVSFIAMYINYLSGYQSALMAPTEILANQHYINMLNVFKEYNINIELLTGKTKNKKKILEDLNNGKIDMIVGTHALIQDTVTFKNLGLVITDEQHRFGVNQRSNLKNKGKTPDILYMSATPIPRTYALTVYGDMDVSSIRTMPSGRKSIITYLKKTNEMIEILNMMYNELKDKHQVYVIAPLIEESEKIDLENVNELEGKFNKAFKNIYKIGTLHGRMENKEKEQVMRDFKENKIQILISTTVVEVGVDVPNATMMVIFDSYRFGLSALHQLRGRVGRNNLQSYCVLISDYEKERLDILTKTHDGFEISEEDFRLRGSGDLFGIKQSGDMAFKLADIKNDYNMLLKAREDSIEILKNIKHYDNLYNIIINDKTS